jgi:hypothetical protein
MVCAQVAIGVIEAGVLQDTKAVITKISINSLVLDFQMTSILVHDFILIRVALRKLIGAKFCATSLHTPNH